MSFKVVYLTIVTQMSIVNTYIYRERERERERERVIGNITIF